MIKLFFYIVNVFTLTFLFTKLIYLVAIEIVYTLQKINKAFFPSLNCLLLSLKFAFNNFIILTTSKFFFYKIISQAKDRLLK